MSPRKNEALRVCLGCRRKKAQRDMVRMVRDPEGRVVFDIGSRLPGRGAWICPDISCLDSLRPSSLGHVLKADVSLPTSPLLRSQLGSTLENKCRNLLTIGRKAGQVAIGSKAVREAHDRHRVELFLLSCDASHRTGEGLRRRAGEIPVSPLPNRDLFGKWMGKRSVATAAVLDRGLARRLESLLRILTAIEYPPYHSANEFSTQED